MAEKPRELAPNNVSNDPTAHSQTECKQQPSRVQDVVATLTSAACGGAMGGLVGSFTQVFGDGPLIGARNIAVLEGANMGILCVMRRLTDKIDVRTRMVAGFGSGVMYSLVSGMGGPSRGPRAITFGVFFALVEGGYFKVKEKLLRPSMYMETKSMLSRLNLEKYEKNFKKGLLTDNTLPLLTERQVYKLKKWSEF
ncbi:hypothetical protein QVD17_08134 [Tagetes erecta]|uniref:Mitochondrial import inner membrane translocase subunit TIM22 n=1 Tax=Tagetes erecta TaxID=13708 RepID=A0AAD8L5I1_TARER|nr:hypothetical protein QVD17_08134 [Tagetes erecta]